MFHRTTLPFATIALSALLAGCAAGTSSAPARASSASRTPSAAGIAAEIAAEIAAREQRVDEQVLHVLNRLAFGPRPGEVDRVRQMGVDAWIAQQLEPQRIPDPITATYVASFRSLDKTGGELIEQYPPPGVAFTRLARENGARGRRADAQGNVTITAEDSMRIRAAAREGAQLVGEVATSRLGRAVLSERQLEEVMVDFWHNHFNVFSGKDRTRYFLAEYDTRAIRPHAMGKFRELLGAVAKSPAMLYYLDNWQSVADSGRPTLAQLPNGPRARAARQRLQQQIPALNRRRGLNENYARELMELHTLGVDGGYSQKDVVDVARALTGWTLDRGANGGAFTFRAIAHDAGEKTILGTRFPAGRGVEEGEQVLDMLARHPNTAKFIATKLARRLVSDTPPATLVTRAAETFRRTDGDIRETVRTIVTSPEFFSNAAYRAKLKNPFELVVSTMRALGATPDATPRVAMLVGRLGQPIFGHQAPNGYPETGDAWLNSGAILNRINFGLAVGAGRVPGVRLNEWPAAATLRGQPREAQVDGVIASILNGAASSDTRQVLLTGTNPFLQARQSADSLAVDGDMSNDMRANAMNANTNARGAQRAPAGLALIVGLAIGAPEFQRR